MKWASRIRASLFKNPKSCPPSTLNSQLSAMTALAVVTALLSGCASSQAVPYNEAQAAPAFTRSQRPPDYLIQPGDELDIKFFFNPELNESVVVGQIGRAHV